MAWAAAAFRRILRRFGYSKMSPADFCHVLGVIGFPPRVANAFSRKLHARGMIDVMLFCDWLYGEEVRERIGEAARAIEAGDKDKQAAGDNDEQSCGDLREDLEAKTAEDAETATHEIVGKGEDEDEVEVRRHVVRFSSVYSNGGTERDLSTMVDKCSLSSQRERREAKRAALLASFNAIVQHLNHQSLERAKA
eukprot:TRINITY_DN35273_c0_g1_i1.p1 TRINITY_DN35273_c0_g1~~TRINITY_DN35273_c0_g1_i1.p1  ORF type:complete len:212 (+),score=45.10 TRINITY_DN35273_c0_g1_i1:57-638(+)